MPSFFRSRRPFKLTKGGWVFILYTVGVGAGAINTGNNLLYLVFGLFLGLILGSGVLSDLTLWGVEVQPLAPQQGRVGEPLLVPVSVRNTKSWFPSLGVRVEIQGTLRHESVSAVGFCPALRPFKLEGCLPIFHPEKRGVLHLTTVTLSTRFPFGLLEKKWSVPLETPVEILVLPQLWKRDPDIPPSVLSRISDRHMSHRRGDGPTLFGIRDYRPGDHPKRIHWKASAKLSSSGFDSGNAGWMVREMEEEADPSLILRWPEPDFAPSEKEFERFVSYAASLIHTFTSRQWSVSLVGGLSDSPWYLNESQLARFLATVASGNFIPDFTSSEGPDEADAIDLKEAYEMLSSAAVRS